MLRSCIEAIEPQITGLGLFQRYGGLVRKVSQPSMDGQTVTFPVSCSVSSTDCWQGGKYKDLVPDSSKKSIAYWEFLQGMKQVEQTGGMIVKQGAARFVCWLNIAQMNFFAAGDTDCSVADDVQLALEKALEQRVKFTHRSLTSEASAKFELDRVVEPGSAIFDPYSYKSSEMNIEAFTMYPFEVMAFDFTITATYRTGCVSPLVPGTAITCEVL